MERRSARSGKPARAGALRSNVRLASIDVRGRIIRIRRLEWRSPQSAPSHRQR